MEVKLTSVSDAYNIALQNHVSYLNCKPEFVSIIAQTFEVNPICLIVYHKELPLLSIIAYAKDKKIIHPTTYIYTSIWKTSNSVILIEMALTACILSLQKSYKLIEFLLPPSIPDIRAFIYCGFRSDVKYTYINNLENINPNPNIITRWKKALKLKIEFNDLDSSDILHQQIESFVHLGYKSEYVETINRFITNLMRAGFIYPLSARLNKKLIASAYIMIDWDNKNALNLFITSDKKNYSTGVHSSLYLYNFYQLKKKGILTNDLFGATTKGIGGFKSSFNGDLAPYYHVRYNYFRWSIIKFANNLKSIRRGKLSK